MHKLAQCVASFSTHNCSTATSALLEWEDRQSNYGSVFPNSLSRQQETSYCERMRHHQEFNIFNTSDIKTVMCMFYYHFISIKRNLQMNSWLKLGKESICPDSVTSTSFFFIFLCCSRLNKSLENILRRCFALTRNSCVIWAFAHLFHFLSFFYFWSSFFSCCHDWRFSTSICFAVPCCTKRDLNIRTLILGCKPRDIENRFPLLLYINAYLWIAKRGERG